MSRISNTQTLNTLRHMSKSSNSKASSLKKMSSGSRIVSASDDAAGLAISEKVKARFRSRGQAVRNANDAISVVQVLEGGLHEMNSMIIRMRELSVHSASDTVSDTERKMMNLEAGQLIEEIDRIAKSQEIFGNKLMLGNNKSLDIQVDAGNTSLDKVQINLKDLAHTSYALGINDVKIDSKLQSNLSMFKLDHALKEISKSTAKMGSLSSRFRSTVNKLQVDVENGKSANSRIRDLDYASEAAKNVKTTIMQNAQTAVLAQSNANNATTLKLLE